MLIEFFEDSLIELDRLRAVRRDEGPDADTEERIIDLEQLFSDEAVDLRNLSPDESLENWFKPRKTGDPEVDRWEEQIARGETPDLGD